MSIPSHSAFADALADLRVLGVELSERGEHYGLVAARSNPRWWILPLSSGSHARAGLGLFHPVSLAAQVTKSGASLACRLGLQRFAFRPGPRLTGADRLATRFPGGKASSVAIFTGTDGPHRKTTIQFSDHEGRILGYAKLSRSRQVIPWIETEARALKEVNALHLRTADVPQMLDLQRIDTAVVLITDSSKDRSVTTPRELTPAHAAFLAELADRTRHNDWHGYVDTLRRKFAAVQSVMGSEWQGRMDAALQRLSVAPPLPIVLAHGDFTPWNSFLGDHLYVFDWEYAGYRAVSHDVVHFTLATRLLQDAASLEAAAFSALGALQPQLNVHQALLAYLCDHTLLFAQREHEGLTRIDGWANSTHLSPLFDRLLSNA